MRVGVGFDIHPFSKDRELWLGGVKIPHELGLYGVSDADVLLHAISDAILGAASEPDIGELFPAESSEGMNSLEILRKCMERVKAKGFRVVNIDCVIIAQEPRLSKFIPLMRGRISEVLGIPDVNIKAKSPERLGFLGRGEGIAAICCALLK